MKISVIMPVYNSERYVHASIESVLTQSYPNIELIVVDDGSTDQSAEIVKSFKDKRIKYLFQENKGVRKLAETINFGLEFSTGDLVTMFPSDDLCEKNRFELQVKTFEDDSVVLSFGKMKLINELGNDIGTCRTLPNHEYVLSGSFERLLEAYILENFIPEPTVLLRKSVLLDVGGYSQPTYMYAEDYPTQMKFVGRGKWVFINEYLAKYRIHDAQMTRTYVMPMFRSDARYRLQLVKNLPQEVLDKFYLSRNKLRKKIIQKMYYGYYQIGKSLAQLGNTELSVKYFNKAILKSNLVTAIKSNFALAAIVIGLDVNKLIKYLRLFYR